MPDTYMYAVVIISVASPLSCYFRTVRVYLGLVFSFLFFFFVLLGLHPRQYGGSQARGRIRAVVTGLHHSHSKARYEPHLGPTSQLMAMPDP